ncbi:hypothetical protein [Wolbachia endosymbiont (group A) of Tiphia femorata]|nr:hypothetical protein [Wolbachia endosymbiont (group A) of Tiphia femorata]
MHKKLDPSVTHWDDKKRATRVTSSFFGIPVGFVASLLMKG